MRIFKTAGLILLIAFKCAFAGAQGGEDETLTVTANADKEKIEIGDRIKLKVVAENPSDLELIFPDIPEHLGEFSLIDVIPVKKGFGRGRETGREYVLSIYTTGTHVIPPMKVMFRSEGAEEWGVTESPQVPVEVMSVLDGDDRDIKDLKGILRVQGSLSRGIFTLISLLGLVAVLLILWKRKFASEGEAAVLLTAHEIALEELRRLKAMDLPGKGQVKEYYTRLSDIVRRYLENRFSYRAPEMTTEEFLEFVSGSSRLEQRHKELLGDFLSKCDMVKFAKYGPTPIESVDSFKAAESLVEQTKEEVEEAVA